MKSTTQSAAITVRAPVLSRAQDGRVRVTADIDGTEVYVTANEPMVANGDAWASMLLLPAAKSRAMLDVESDVDSRLHANFGAIQTIARNFWGFEGAVVRPRRLIERKPSGGHAMLFTCGVDSFYTLRKRLGSVDRLIFVRGLNINLIDLDDTTRFKAVREGIAAVARELGIHAVFAETNLRSHPTFSRVGWDVSHMGAFAGVAHALAPVVSRVYVASSDIPAPYGSRPELDPLWSSGAVEVVNDGSETLKPEKVQAIADWPLVHRYLRVCYSPRAAGINCGMCKKCVRTQLLFAIAGMRDRLQTFPQTPLVDLIDGIPWIATSESFLWTTLLPSISDPNLTAAIARLLARRPSMVDRLKTKGLWLRTTSAGRLIRRGAKRLLVR